GSRVRRAPPATRRPDVASDTELRERLQRRPGMGGLSDADADDRIAEAAEMVRGYCGWHVWPSEDQTVTVDARGGDMVPLPTLKLTAVDTVEHRELYDHTSTWTAATSGWDFSEGGWLLASGCWPDGPRTVRVAMTSGWPDCPRGVAAVVVGLA